MGIKVTWNEAQTTATVSFSNVWTWAEVHQFLTTFIPEIDAQPQSNHVIVDMTASNEVPLNSITQARYILENTNPQVDRIILVGGPILLTMLKLFQATVPHLGNRVSFARSLSEAQTLLAAPNQDAPDSAPSDTDLASR